MTLTIKPEHRVKDMLQESRVTHMTFRNEDGMLRFLEDNRTAIRSRFERWNVDFEPMLTVTAR